MNRRLRLAAAFILCVSAAWAVDWKTLKPQGYLSDFAGVVDAASRAQIETYCSAVERATGAQLALVTISSLEGEPVEDVANTIFRGWGVGQRTKNNGILLLFSIGDHRDRAEVGYGLEPILTDGEVGSILRQVRPLLANQQYGQAMMSAAQQVGDRIAAAKHVAIGARLPQQPQSSPMQSIPWPLVIGGIMFVFWLLRGRVPYSYRGYSGGGFLPGMILGSVLGRSSWGSRGSGGFGGPDSGDGFGGFGGGDSGGGGASSDW